MSIPACLERPVEQRSGRRAPRSFRGGLCVLSLLALSSVALSAARAEDAQAILDKMTALYRNAKSFQTTLIVRETVTKDGQSSVLTKTTQIAFKSPNHYSMLGSWSASGPLAAQLANKGEKTATITDGQTFWAYNGAKNQYFKIPVPPKAKSMTAVEFLQLPTPEKGTLKLLPSAIAQGRPAYVVEMLPTPPPTARVNPNLKRLPLQLLIDKQNYQLLQVKPGTGSKVQAEKDITQQTINGNIADTVFQFTPPAGATEFKIPRRKPNPPGGAPGAPKK